MKRNNIMIKSTMYNTRKEKIDEKSRCKKV